MTFEDVRPTKLSVSYNNMAPLLLFMVICLLGFSRPSQADTYVFVGSNFPVLSEKAQDGTLQGIGIEIARVICKRLGHTPSIRLYPWARSQAMVKSGRADVLIAPYKTTEREQWLDFSKIHFFEDQSFFYIRPGSDITWNGDILSIRHYRIGKVHRWSVGPSFENARPHLSIDYAPTIDLCFQKLIRGRVDLVPTQPREANAAFKRLDLPDQARPVAIYPALESNHLNYYGFSKKKRKELSEFKKAFDAMLEQMHTTGEVKQLTLAIYKRHRDAP